MHPRPYQTPGRPSRRGVPRLALAAIAVLPALLVSACIVMDSRDDAPPSAPLATATTTSATSTTTRAGVEVAPPSDRAGAATAPEEDFKPPPVALNVAPPEITASAAIVVDDGSLEVLYSKDGYSRRAPASLTKIATAIVAAEQAGLDEEVTSDVHYWDLDDSSTMGLEPGDVFTVRELLYGLMLVSGNDAAITLGRHVAGSDGAFVALMNDLVERLGLEDTRFMNASGLHHDRHYSSPWDLVMLSRALMRMPELREVVGTEEHTALGERPVVEHGADGSGDDGDREPVGLDLYNHNPLLNYTPGVDGVKTGFVEEAGRTFSVTAERGGHRIYIVLLDTTLRAQDSMDLIEWAFANHKWP